MTAPDPALTARAETAYPCLALYSGQKQPCTDCHLKRRAFIAGALSEREAMTDGEGMEPLPAEARFSAYYYDFEPTGIGAVDAVLSAVAIAGKGAHHTESWNEDNSYWSYDHPGLVDASNAVELIQKNANRAATIMSAQAAEIARLRMALEEAQKR